MGKLKFAASIGTISVGGALAASGIGELLVLGLILIVLTAIVIYGATKITVATGKKTVAKGGGLLKNKTEQEDDIEQL